MSSEGVGPEPPEPSPALDGQGEGQGADRLDASSAGGARRGGKAFTVSRTYGLSPYSPKVARHAGRARERTTVRVAQTQLGALLSEHGRSRSAVT